MAQTLPPTPLPEGLIGTQGPAPAAPVASLTPASDAMQQTVQDPTGDFFTAFVRLMESKGIDLDDAMAPPTVQDEADIASNPDPLQYLTEEELTMLVQKFLAIPEPEQSRIKEQLLANLPPQVGQRLEAVLRFVTGKAGQQQASLPQEDIV